MFEDTKKYADRMGWALFALAAVSNLVQMGAAVLIAEVRPEWTESPWFTVSMIALGFYLCGLPLFWAMTRTIPAQKTEGQGHLRPRQLLRSYLLCMFLGYVCSWFGQLLSSIVSTVTGTVTSNPVEQLVGISGMLPTLLTAGICSPVAEEIVFRRLMLDRVRGYGDKAAVFCTAAAFGLMHMNLYQFFYAFFIGIVLARITLHTGSIREAVLLHIAINITGSVLMPFLLGVPFGGAVILLIFGSVLIFGGRLFWKKRRRLFAFENAAADEEMPESREDVPEEENPPARHLWLNIGMMAYLVLCIAGFVYSFFML